MKSSSVQYLLPEAHARVAELVAEQRYIQAIKLVREVTGAGLAEAKEYVDGMKGEIFARRVPPEVQARARAMIAEGKVKPAIKMVRVETELGLQAAKDYVHALREGRVHAPPPGGHAVLSDRVRAFKYSGDHESAIALVCAETGMRRDEAARFVEAIR
ncbi:ribosomal protein L7/L12 [Actinomadura formosensis]|uniref:ribosomal protein L7/L12 n=1 Tax=Actinomadura formosensis TaxID=60706 RepID=UPI0008327A31|nr:ribosomal protein L7/L12 [Actinomadura formosensis]